MNRRKIIGTSILLLGGIFSSFLFSQILILGTGDTTLYPSSSQDSSFISPYGISSTLISRHLDVGFGKGDTFEEATVMQLIKQMKEYIQLDILSLLDFNYDKEKTLDLYLGACYNLINDGGIAMSNYKSDLKEYESLISDCTADKTLANKDYFTAFQDYDYDFMQQSLEASLLAQQCVDENKVRFNATSVILKTLDVYSQVLTKKYDYLSNKHDMIITNFPLLKPQLLEELAAITAVLEQFADSESK